MLIVTPRIAIPDEELQFTYARSSGPGGQNVNKVSSKAVLRFAAASASLPEDVRERFLARYASRLTGDGDLVITSQRYRDQSRNAADCLEKLRAMIAEVVPPPRIRKRTRPTRAARERRLQEKRVAGQRKQSRRRPHGDE